MAEVFSATIRERRRGRVVGQKSNGSVVGATSFKLPDGGQLSVGIVEIRTGSGAVLQGRGVEPDIFVEPTLDDVRLGRDTMLETAVRAVLAGQRT
jgi:carboxyl-terminal processing protease